MPPLNRDLVHLRKIMLTACAAFALTFLASAGWSRACSAAEFYRGKTINIAVGFGPGGGYDIAARLLARHLGDHIPGHPKVIVTNMPGASGLTLLNYLYALAPRDGTFIGTFHSASPFYETLKMPGIRFKSAEFSWIGNLSKDVSALAVWRTTGIRTLDDAKKKQVVMGALSGVGISNMYPKVLNKLFGTKFKIVTGYNGMNEINLAMERGEVQGSVTAWSSWKSARPQWIPDKKLIPLVQIGPEKDVSLPNVPLLSDLANSADEKSMFNAMSANIAIERPFAAPPGIPMDRLKILRDGFNATVRDPDFLADAAKARVPIGPNGGKQTAVIVESVVNTPEHIIDQLRATMGM